jgi:hypothetical protein
MNTFIYVKPNNLVALCKALIVKVVVSWGYPLIDSLPGYGEIFNILDRVGSSVLNSLDGILFSDGFGKYNKADLSSVACRGNLRYQININKVTWILCS